MVFNSLDSLDTSSAISLCTKINRMKYCLFVYLDKNGIITLHPLDVRRINAHQIQLGNFFFCIQDSINVFQFCSYLKLSEVIWPRNINFKWPCSYVYALAATVVTIHDLRTLTQRIYLTPWPQAVSANKLYFCVRYQLQGCWC